MGYRSNVTIQCKEKAFKLFKEAWESVSEDNYFKPNKVLKSDDIYTFMWYDVKWYESFDDVTAITNVMNKLDDDYYCKNEEYAYKLIRLGEEYGDIEIRENDASWYELDDFYPIIEVNLPDVYEEIEV